MVICYLFMYLFINLFSDQALKQEITVRIRITDRKQDEHENHLRMKTTINKTCQSGRYHIHNIGCIKRFLSFEDRNLIVQAIVTSRIDYCNSLLYGVAATNLSKLQRVQNAAVQSVCSLPRHEHVTLSFICLHWQPIKFRINFKIAICSVSSAFIDMPPII